MAHEQFNKTLEDAASRFQATFRAVDHELEKLREFRESIVSIASQAEATQVNPAILPGAALQELVKSIDLLEVSLRVELRGVDVTLSTGLAKVEQMLHGPCMNLEPFHAELTVPVTDLTSERRS